MRENLIKMTFAEQEKRLSGLLSILRISEIPFTLRRSKIGHHWIENIIVSINKGTPRLVVGAHYDSVEGSTGANDNAAAVSILIELAKEFTKNPPKLPVDIVFFDREEYEDKGSEEYVRSMDKENISAMINLDVCGVGDRIVFGPGKNLEKGPLSDILGKVKVMEKHGARIVDYLPPGDEKSFEAEGIPNISLAILPDSEVEAIVKFAECIYKKQEPQPGEFTTMPSIIETMHNGPRDCPETVEEEPMKKVLDFLMDVLYSYK